MTAITLAHQHRADLSFEKSGVRGLRQQTADKEGENAKESSHEEVGVGTGGPNLFILRRLGCARYP
jgi:hypothetical protein